MKISKTQAKEKIKKLVKKFEKLSPSEFKKINEADTRRLFILPLFHALGWDVYGDFITNEVAEEETSVSGRIDYSFRINSVIQFLLEAKAIPEDLNKEKWAHQAVEYGWNKGIPWVVLTDFEGLKVFNSEWKVDKPKANLIFSYKDYLEKFDRLWLLSKESFEKNGLDKLLSEFGITAKRVSVNEKLAEDLVNWRNLLTKNLKLWNEKISEEEIEEAIQRILDRLIFIRVVEDRDIEEKILWQAFQKWQANHFQPNNFIELLIPLFRRFDEKYNSNLFQKHLCENLDTEGDPFRKIIPQLCGEKEEGVKYRFDAIDADVLGEVYEQYLGSVQRREGEKSKRKKQGIYYTPTYIVDYIVQNTVGKLLEEKTSLSEKENIKVLDPACGSGSFLIKSFEVIDEYLKNLRNKENKDPIQSAIRKYRILTQNLYGVDLDEQAIEIARLNLLLKALVPEQRLPLLTKHMKIGNSLISDEKIAKKAFKWKKEFPETFKGDNPGFDVIIGNPPYGGNLKSDEKKYFFANSKLSEYQLDTYVLFLERSIELLKKNGFLGLILPNTWLINIKMQKLRKFLIKFTEIHCISSYSQKIFKSATVDNVVLIIRNKPPDQNNEMKITLVNQSGQTQHFVKQSLWENEKVFNIHMGGVQRNIIKKIQKDTKSLNKVCNVSVGIKPYQVGKGKPKQTRKVVSNRNFDYHRKEDSTTRLYLRGRDINRYTVKINSNQWLKYGPWLAEPRSKELFDDDQKIFIRQTGDSLIAALDESKLLCLNNMHVISLKDKKYNLKYILGLINSRLFDFFYYYLNPEKGEALAEVKATNVKRLPVKKTNLTTYQEFAKKIVLKVNKMLRLNKKLLSLAKNSDKWSKLNDEIKKTDREIDKIVYKLYGLTQEEIKIVEKNTK